MRYPSKIGKTPGSGRGAFAKLPKALQDVLIEYGSDHTPGRPKLEHRRIKRIKASRLFWATLLWMRDESVRNTTLLGVVYAVGEDWVPCVITGMSQQQLWNILNGFTADGPCRIDEKILRVCSLPGLGALPILASLGNASIWIPRARRK